MRGNGGRGPYRAATERGDVHTIPKLGSPSGITSVPPTMHQTYAKFCLDFPKVDIDAPWREGNGLWVARWFSPDGGKVEFSARMSKWEMFFKEMREVANLHFPTG